MAKTYLAFDYGTQRIGLAVGNDLLGTCEALLPITTQQLQKPDGRIVIEHISKLIKTWKVNHLVFGLPFNTTGQDTPLCKHIKRLGKALSRELSLPVSYADERYSTAEADRLLREQLRPGKSLSHKKIALRDSIAAQLILEAYFSHQT